MDAARSGVTNTKEEKMVLDFEDRRLIRWLMIYGASVAAQAEIRKIRCSDGRHQDWSEIFDRASDVANMDRENGSSLP
jgi:hypothetical protein